MEFLEEKIVIGLKRHERIKVSVSYSLISADEKTPRIEGIIF